MNKTKYNLYIGSEILQPQKLHVFFSGLKPGDHVIPCYTPQCGEPVPWCRENGMGMGMDVQDRDGSAGDG